MNQQLIKASHEWWWWWMDDGWHCYHLVTPNVYVSDVLYWLAASEVDVTEGLRFKRSVRVEDHRDLFP